MFKFSVFFLILLPLVFAIDCEHGCIIYSSKNFDVKCGNNQFVLVSLRSGVTQFNNIDDIIDKNEFQCFGDMILSVASGNDNSQFTTESYTNNGNNNNNESKNIIIEKLRLEKNVKLWEAIVISTVMAIVMIITKKILQMLLKECTACWNYFCSMEHHFKKRNSVASNSKFKCNTNNYSHCNNRIENDDNKNEDEDDEDFVNVNNDSRNDKENLSLQQREIANDIIVNNDQMEEISQIIPNGNVFSFDNNYNNGDIELIINNYNNNNNENINNNNGNIDNNNNNNENNEKILEEIPTTKNVKIVGQHKGSEVELSISPTQLLKNFQKDRL